MKKFNLKNIIILTALIAVSNANQTGSECIVKFNKSCENFAGNFVNRTKGAHEGWAIKNSINNEVLLINELNYFTKKNVFFR